eukprot:UN23384
MNFIIPLAAKRAREITSPNHRIAESGHNQAQLTRDRLRLHSLKERFRDFATQREDSISTTANSERLRAPGSTGFRQGSSGGDNFSDMDSVHTQTLFGSPFLSVDENVETIKVISPRSEPKNMNNKSRKNENNSVSDIFSVQSATPTGYSPYNPRQQVQKVTTPTDRKKSSSVFLNSPNSNNNNNGIMMSPPDLPGDSNNEEIPNKSSGHSFFDLDSSDMHKEAGMKAIDGLAISDKPLVENPDDDLLAVGALSGPSATGSKRRKNCFENG